MYNIGAPENDKMEENSDERSDVQPMLPAPSSSGDIRGGKERQTHICDMKNLGRPLRSASSGHVAVTDLLAIPC